MKNEGILLPVLIIILGSVGGEDKRKGLPPSEDQIATSPLLLVVTPYYTGAAIYGYQPRLSLFAPVLAPVTRKPVSLAEPLL